MGTIELVDLDGFTDVMGDRGVRLSPRTGALAWIPCCQILSARF